MAKLAPSILSADFSALAEDVRAAESGGSDFIHVDVMDGHFVPNISFGAGIMKCLNGKVSTPYDVHLMIENPDKYIGDFVTEYTEYITVHQEASVHLDRTIEYIKSFGVKAGVAINPATPVDTLRCVLEKADLVLVMSVNPGFGGQKLIPYTLDKIRELADIREKCGFGYQIEIDGGASLDNAAEISAAGTDIIVAGSAVFKAPDISERVREFMKLIK